MAGNELAQHGATLVKGPTEKVLVEGVVHLVETYHRHGHSAELLLEALSHLQLLGVELLVAVENAHLDDRLDDVFHELLGRLFRARVVARHAVHLVQQARRRVVDEVLGDLLGRHLAQQLLLGPEAQ